MLKKILLASLLSLSFSSYAQTLSQFESGLLKQYQQTEINSRIDADQYNQQIAEAIQKQLLSNPASFNYSFKQLVDAGKLSINYSPDKKLKFYSFDISSGGTMREFETWVQINSGKRIVTQQVPTASLVQNVYQTNFKNMTVYLVRDIVIGSSREGAYSIQALQLSRQKLRPVQIFETKTKKLSEITVEYDRAHFPENQPAFEDYQQLPQQFIRVSKDLKYIDIRVIQASGKLTSQYLRYVKAATAYHYQGTVQ